MIPVNDSAISQFLRPLEHVEWKSDEEVRPFLSVVIRTQGHRGALLCDALVCLAGQSNQDFEVLLVLHDPDHDDRASELSALVESETPSLRDRVTVHVSRGATRSRPLNDAIEIARGRYVAFFDDDDLLLANWVSTFAQLAQRYPGRVLRSVVVDQEFSHEMWGSHRGLIAAGPVSFGYADSFTLHEHLLGGATPFHGFAFPRSIFQSLGFRFDESMSIYEDWDLQLRAAAIVGVGSSNEVTAIYRRHRNVDDSLMLHSASEREQLLDELVRERLNSKYVLIAGEELIELRSSSKQVERMWIEKDGYHRENIYLNEQVHAPRWLANRLYEILRDRFQKRLHR